jgi:RNA polymerase sigma-70 factor (ECF subfamily)
MAMTSTVPAQPADGAQARPGSFEQAFLEHYDRVVLIAYRILGDREAAEDVAQEVFLALHDKAGPDGAGTGAGWLWAASAHRALNAVRGEKRRRGREMRAGMPTPGPAGPEEDAIAAEQRATVRAALARIPGRQAEVLALRAAGLSYADIASATGVPPGNVGTLICRAQRALRKELTSAETPI